MTSKVRAKESSIKFRRERKKAREKWWQRGHKREIKYLQNIQVNSYVAY
jgi:hypothetical protein